MMRFMVILRYSEFKDILYYITPCAKEYNKRKIETKKSHIRLDGSMVFLHLIKLSSIYPEIQSHTGNPYIQETHNKRSQVWNLPWL